MLGTVGRTCLSVEIAFPLSVVRICENWGHGGDCISGGWLNWKGLARKWSWCIWRMRWKPQGISGSPWSSRDLNRLPAECESRALLLWQLTKCGDHHDYWLVCDSVSSRKYLQKHERNVLWKTLVRYVRVDGVTCHRRDLGLSALMGCIRLVRGSMPVWTELTVWGVTLSTRRPTPAPPSLPLWARSARCQHFRWFWQSWRPVGNLEIRETIELLCCTRM
jgi:hypothetical protein